MADPHLKDSANHEAQNRQAVMTADDFQRQVAGRIKGIRRGLGLAQRHFEQHGYNVRHYQKIESGEMNLTLKTLLKVANAMKADVSHFIRADDESTSVYEDLFVHCPFGIIIWRLPDFNNPDSLCLHDHNIFAVKAVCRDLPGAKGQSMLSIFPKAREQGVLDIISRVIITGEPQAVPELVRHDENFPLTVFSSRFVKCGSDLGAAIFVDITESFLQRQSLLRLPPEPRLPRSESERIVELQREVDHLLKELGRFPRYENADLSRQHGGVKQPENNSKP